MITKSMQQYKNISHAAWGGPTKTKYVKAQVTIGTNTPPQRYKRWKNQAAMQLPMYMHSTATSGK
jgi:hypothetical protein